MMPNSQPNNILWMWKQIQKFYGPARLLDDRWMVAIENVMWSLKRNPEFAFARSDLNYNGQNELSH